MKIQPSPAQFATKNAENLKKEAPKQVFEPGQEVSITRTFDVPVYNNERLGSIPDDNYEYEWNPAWPRWRFGWSETISSHGGSTEFGSQGVYRDVPVYTASGQPQMKTVTETLTEKSYNQKSSTLWSAGLGAAAGLGGTALVGALQSAQALHPLAAVAGVVLGGVAGAAIGYKAAAGDKIEEKWEARSIDHPRMVGYEHNINPDTYTVETNCKTDSQGKRECDTQTHVRGYWHRYEPDLRWRQVGSYERPTLQHTNAISPLGATALGAVAGGALGVGIRLLTGLI